MWCNYVTTPSKNKSQFSPNVSVKNNIQQFLLLTVFITIIIVILKQTIYNWTAVQQRREIEETQTLQLITTPCRCVCITMQQKYLLSSNISTERKRP